MTLAPSLTASNHLSLPSALFKPNDISFHQFRLSFRNETLFVNGNRKLPTESWRIGAKKKELVIINPSVTVEEGKYIYEVKSFIERLSSLPPRGSIARCLEPSKNKLSMNDFALVFKEFAQHGEWQRCLRLFKYMQRQIWCKPNEQIYIIMITLLGREGLLEKCQEIFHEMPSHGVPRSVFSYTAIINAYGRNGHYETALELLDKMKKERISPSILTYNTVINACARGALDWEGLLGLFAEMRHEGIQPDLVTYNILLCACAGRGLGDGAEKLFRAMYESGVVPDVSTYGYLVETFRKQNELEKVLELLREMESGGHAPDVTSYNVLLDAYAELGSIKEAADVFRQMQSTGCVPNADTYSILLNLYGKHGRYDDVRELFLQMKVSNTEPDTVTYNILIQVFGKGGYFKEVVTLFHDMMEEKIEPNMDTYEGLIFACGKGGLHEDAKKILIHMNDVGIVPSSSVFTGAIEAYGCAALYEEAFVAFNRMNELGKKPTAETYNSLILAFARGGLYPESEAIAMRMAEMRIPRNVDTFNGLIEAFRQGGRFEDAIKVYAAMEDAKCDPNVLTFEAVLGIYCFAGLVEEGEEQFLEIKSSGTLPSVMCYCMMLALYAKNGRVDDAYNLLDEMSTTKVSDVHQVIGQMIRGDYDDGSNWQIVEYIFDKINSEGCALGMKFCNALLEALWWLGQKERSARVLNEASKRGLFPELFRRSKLIWSVDVHRMWEGGACTAISVWLNNMLEMVQNRESLPQLATVVVIRGRMEKSSEYQDFPIAKAAFSFLQDQVPSSFSFPDWNNGRIACQRAQLKRLLSDTKSSSDGIRDNLIPLTNTPLYGKEKSANRHIHTFSKNVDSRTGADRRVELLTSTV